MVKIVSINTDVLHVTREQLKNEKYHILHINAVYFKVKPIYLPVKNENQKNLFNSIFYAGQAF